MIKHLTARSEEEIEFYFAEQRKNHAELYLSWSLHIQRICRRTKSLKQFHNIKSLSYSIKNETLTILYKDSKKQIIKYNERIARWINLKYTELHVHND